MTRRRWTLKTGAASAGLAASALWAPPAAALDGGIRAEVGLYLSWTLGAESGGFGFGLQGRGIYVPSEPQCGSSAPSGFAASSLRLGFVDLRHPRLLVSAQGGAIFAEIFSAAGELGIGYRFGEGSGIDAIAGVELGALYGLARADFEPSRRELALEAGFRIPSFDTNQACYVIGRPQRTDGGVAARPELRLQRRDEPLERGVLAWCDRARTEWASVPAFFDLADQLRLSGAPPALIDRAYEAASDEVRHAVLSAGLASAHAGVDMAIDSSALSPRAPLAGEAGLVRLAVESWIDGCVGEGLAASVAGAEARLDRAPPHIRAVQRSIARDESAHAALAWDVLTWSLGQAEAPVRAALEATRLAAAPEPDADPAVDLRSFGCLDPRSLAQVRARHHAAAHHSLESLLDGRA